MKVTAILLLFLIYYACLSATIINIPEDFSTIQEGITLSVQGDTVLVAPGTYVENINYSGKNITVASLFHTTQDTSYISQTIIDGDSLGSVITFESGEDSTAVLTGFTITNGSNFAGGGIHCYGYSNPILGNIRISGNSANYGGGISIVHYSNPILENVTISDNTAFNYGGGIRIGYYSSPILENVTISDNTASGGGGISCSDHSIPTLKNVLITGNSASNNGGGIYCHYYSNLFFDPLNLSNIFLNFAGTGNDLYNVSSIMNVIVDTFTILQPEDNIAWPIYNFTFDIQNAKIEQVNQDLYVSPFGSDDNSGLSSAVPLQTIDYALEKIISDSTNPNTIYLTNGTYSSSQTEEHFPIHCKSYISLVGEDESLTILDGETRGIILFSDDSNLLLSNLTVTNGSWSGRENGGITCQNSNPILENITITNNFGIEGGGITCYGSNPILANVAITNNSGWDASGIYCRNSNPILINVTLEGNADNFGSSCGICCWDNSNPILINCIMWNELTVEIKFFDLYQPNTITIANSDIEGGIEAINTNNNGTVNWLEGNIDVDPLFINTIIGDYHLQDTSLCIGAGINEIEINEIWYYSPDFDIEGNLRPSPEGSMPDMGAYENILGEPQVGTFDDLTFTINYLYNFPNPFNPETTISFNLSKVENIELEIFNIKGQKVKTLLNEQLSIGKHTVVWDGKDANNKQVSSGIYMYKLKAGDIQQTKKMILLK